MKRFSHILSFLAVALFILAMASTANADGTDPSIIIQNSAGPIGTTFIPDTTFSFFTVTGGDCTFTSPTPHGGAGDCFIANSNTAGLTWIAIDLEISQMIDKSLVTCPAATDPLSAFASCVVTNDPADGTVDVSLSGGSGVAFGNEAFIGISGWNTCTAPGPAGCVTFDGTITLSSVPEPATLTLLLTGGGFFLARRRRQNVPKA